MKKPARTPAAVVLLLLALAPAAPAATEVKPGWNLFSKQQDIQLGKEAAQEIEAEVEVVKDSRLNEYVAGIGQRLVRHSQDPDYPYTFKVVADSGINAFALPGGPIYIHSGLITAADNEAQLAGVLSHEIAHVALRHSTNRASKAYAFQIPLLLAGGLLDNKGGLLPALTKIGVSFGVNSVLLKYSRSAEKDADIVGAQTMARAGYDPVEMANFFEKLEASGGNRAPEFFSSHPNPGNRVRYVEEEVEDFPRRSYQSNSPEFERMKARAARIEPSKKRSSNGSPSDSSKPAAGSGTAGQTAAAAMEIFRARSFEIAYPEGWKAHRAREGEAVTLAPEDGVVRGSNSGPAIARGVLAGYFATRERNLRRATDALIADLRRSNRLEQIRGRRETIRVGGREGESVLLLGDSALGGGQREFIWAVTALDSPGLFYALFVTPESEYQQRRPTYESMLGSIRFK